MILIFDLRITILDLKNLQMLYFVGKIYCEI